MWIFLIIAVIGIASAIEINIYKKHWSDGLSAQIFFKSATAFQGDEVELVEVIKSTGRLPLPWVSIKFQVSRDIHLPDSTNSSVTDYYNREDVFSVGRDEKITRRLPAVCARRGLHRIHSVDMICNDFLMIKKLVKNLGGQDSITVYPRMADVPELTSSARRLMGDFIIRRSIHDDPFVFRGVREYMPGDPVKRVNWKVSARADSLCINNYEHTSSLRAEIWLDVNPHTVSANSELCEECIRIAATLASSFIGDGIPTGLKSNGRDCISDDELLLQPGCSFDHCDSCFSALARLDLGKPVRQFKDLIDETQMYSGHDRFIVLVSPFVSPELFSRLQELERDESCELFVIVPARAEDIDERAQPGMLKHYCVWRVEL